MTKETVADSLLGRISIVAVLDNNDLNQVTWEMRAMEGAPQFTESHALPDIAYAEVSKTFDLNGIRVKKPEDLGRAWEMALSASKPTVLDVLVDPDVPALPPHATLAQAEALTGALLKGDPDAIGIVTERLKTKIQEFLPHQEKR